MTRFEIFNRDKHTCQYCGQQTRQLTLDHVIPRYRGGQHTWENVVSACVACNRRKAGRTPREANMKLVREPAPPTSSHFYIIPHHYLSKRDEWRKYLPQNIYQ
jgi:5-methylcytosine-specific restriction endonuclease McrA